MLLLVIISSLAFASAKQCGEFILRIYIYFFKRQQKRDCL